MSRVLVVDDDPASLLVISQSLEAGGHEVRATSDPSAVASLAEEYRPDAVVLDIVMPQLSGFDVLDRLKESRRTKSTPVVFLSSLTGGEDRVKGLRSGALDYIEKPFEPEELLVRIERLIEAEQQTRDLSGSLEVYSLADLLQVLQRDRQSGALIVEGDTTTGRIQLATGRVVACTVGDLSGSEALLDLIALKNGRFRLEQATDLAWTGEVDGPPISIQSLLLETAWLQDELSQVAVPGLDAVVSLGSEDLPALPKAAEDLRLLSLRKIVAEQGSMTAAELGRKAGLAASRFQLALAWSLDLGILEAGTTPMPDLDEVLGHFLANGAARGFCRRPMYLVLLGPESAASCINSLMSDADPGAQRSSAKEKNWIFPSGRCLRLEHPEGLLIVRRQLLAKPLTSENLTSLAIAAGIALWDCPQATEVVDRLSAPLRDAVGVLVSADGRGEARGGRETPVSANAHWNVLNRNPYTLAGLLASLMKSNSPREGTIQVTGSDVQRDSPGVLSDE